MAKSSGPSLALSDVERAVLRKVRIRTAELARLPVADLVSATGWNRDRCRVLCALAQLQSLGSVGPSLARQMLMLGFDGIDSLRGADPAEMYHRMCRLAGHRVDPCVEDVFRCAVAQARFPDLPPEYRDWWRWTARRGEPGVERPEG